MRTADAREQHAVQMADMERAGCSRRQEIERENGEGRADGCVRGRVSLVYLPLTHLLVGCGEVPIRVVQVPLHVVCCAYQS